MVTTTPACSARGAASAPGRFRLTEFELTAVQKRLPPARGRPSGREHTAAAGRPECRGLSRGNSPAPGRSRSRSAGRWRRTRAPAQPPPCYPATARVARQDRNRQSRTPRVTAQSSTPSIWGRAAEYRSPPCCVLAPSPGEQPDPGAPGEGARGSVCALRQHAVSECRGGGTHRVRLGAAGGRLAESRHSGWCLRAGGGGSWEA